MLNERYQQILMDADDGKGGGGTAEQNQEGKSSQYETFEAYLDKQPQEVKELYQKDIHGLKNALDTERTEKKTLSAQLKELSSKAEKGSELEKQLSETLGKMEAAERRAAFAEEAIKPEIGCTNVKAAYALALADNLFDSRGNPNWNEIKQSAPELFRKTGSTDGGAGGKTPPVNDINSAIRAAVGR